jgi:hypothetical protein
MKSGSFSSDSPKQQQSGTISKADTEAAYKKGKSEMLMTDEAN